jgi:tryptophan synthase alpha chain
VLTEYIRDCLKNSEKNILIMTHIVVGYPSLEDSYELVREMVAAGVHLIELQIPFSEPIADGPVIMRANQEALERHVNCEDVLEFAERVGREFDIAFIIMTYLNIPFVYGFDKFASRLKQAGIKGVIVPDLPIEEDLEFRACLESKNISLIPLVAPTTSRDRIEQIVNNRSGFVYCVARKGVTGAETDFSGQIADYLQQVGSCTDLPRAVGFGIKDRCDVEGLIGQAEIAVIGSQSLRVFDKEGTSGVARFLRELVS